MSNAMRVCLLGGAGNVALATLRDLLEIDGDEVAEIVLADMNLEAVQERARNLGSTKVRPVRANIDDRQGLVALLKGMDVLINEAHAGRLQLLGMEAALEAGCHYIDLGTFPEFTTEQLKLDPAFRKAGLTAILGLGNGPGINSVMARFLADKLDCVESIEMSFATVSLAKTSGPLQLPYDVGGLWALMTLRPIVFENGQHVEKPSYYEHYKLGWLEDTQFPDPIGVRKLAFFPHVEPHTIPLYLADKGVRNVFVKGTLSPTVMEKFGLLVDLGLTSPEPMIVRGSPVVPQEVLAACVGRLPQTQTEHRDYGCTRVRVTGERSGQRLDYVAESLSGPYRGMNAVQHRTGHAPAVGARMIHRGIIQRRGVFPPETGVPPEAFFRELRKRELTLRYSCSHGV